METTSPWPNLTVKQAEIELYKHRIEEEKKRDNPQKFDSKTADYAEIFASAIGCSTRAKRLVGVESMARRNIQRTILYTAEASIEDILKYGENADDDNTTGMPASHDAVSTPAGGKRRISTASNNDVLPMSYKVQVGGSSVASKGDHDDSNGEPITLKPVAVPVLQLKKKSWGKGGGEDEDEKPLETARSEAWSLFEEMLDEADKQVVQEAAEERKRAAKEEEEALKHVLRLHEGHVDSTPTTARTLAPERSSLSSLPSFKVPLREADEGSGSGKMTLEDILKTCGVDKYDTGDSVEALRRLTGSSFTAFHRPGEAETGDGPNRRASYSSGSTGGTDLSRVTEGMVDLLTARIGFETLVRRVGPTFGQGPALQPWQQVGRVAQPPSQHPMRTRRHSVASPYSPTPPSPSSRSQPLPRPPTAQPASMSATLPTSPSVPSPNPLSPSASLAQHLSIGMPPQNEAVDMHPLHQQNISSPKQQLSGLSRSLAPHPEDEQLPTIFAVEEDIYVPPPGQSRAPHPPRSPNTARCSSCEPSFFSLTASSPLPSSPNRLAMKSGPRGLEHCTMSLTPRGSQRLSDRGQAPPTLLSRQALGYRLSESSARPSEQMHPRVSTPKGDDLRQHWSMSPSPAPQYNGHDSGEQFQVVSTSTQLSQGNQRLLNQIQKRVTQDSFTFKQTVSIPSLEQEIGAQIDAVLASARGQSPGPEGARATGRQSTDDGAEEHRQGSKDHLCKVGTHAYLLQAGELQILTKEEMQNRSASTLPTLRDDEPRQAANEGRPGTATAMLGRGPSSRPGTKEGTRMGVPTRVARASNIRIALPSSYEAATVASPYGTRMGTIRLSSAQVKNPPSHVKGPANRVQPKTHPVAKELSPGPAVVQASEGNGSEQNGEGGWGINVMAEKLHHRVHA